MLRDIHLQLGTFGTEHLCFCQHCCHCCCCCCMQGQGEGWIKLGLQYRALDNIAGEHTLLPVEPQALHDVFTFTCLTDPCLATHRTSCKCVPARVGSR